ncbi:MAG: hypothetical protein AUJ74_05200 [Candidatus Omnitrophica bacterium CG1_02_44_16]|nr:MAG: hypothetical protein AUJ74_05200 [Candidatus Omnitrophica bacterium CG1_02_44_16]PIY82951.1 MAG: hypothetical protein COY78_04140 [Candidatus Omnitrophica bacterium CG_4_10_14_0_8_um_filter_44_12]PIZ83580.1 MAG: hypothetical protein COX96_07450 [Candidatus Omnitrophica bacterium CG_4_10_14_0_2_um_filter_44_9]
MKKGNALLKFYRSRLGLTQYELAERLGIKERIITLWETNRATPGIETMVDVARVLQTDPAEIWPKAFSSKEAVR